MKTAACLWFDAELGAYLEGENKPFVASHAQECPFCQVVLADLEQLCSLARQLAPAEPSPAVWANLHAVLEEEGMFRRKLGAWDWFRQLQFPQHPAPIGALICLMVLGSLLTLPPVSLERRGTPESASPSKAAVVSLASPSENSALALAIRDMETSYRAGAKFLTPEIKATYEKGLNSLDASIRECTDSLQQQPDNTLAHEYLLTAYTRKAEVLASALEYEGR